jgi:hypothetical protein
VPAMECAISPQMAAAAKNCIFPWADGLLALVEARNFDSEIPAEVRSSVLAQSCRSKTPRAAKP